MASKSKGKYNVSPPLPAPNTLAESMIPDNIFTSVSIFRGQQANFDQWQRRIRIKLAARDLADVLETSKEEMKKDAELQRKNMIALDLLLNHIDDNTLRGLGEIKSAAGLMEKLRNRYATKNLNKVLALRTRLQSLRLRDSVHDHLIEFDEICFELEQQDEKLSDMEKITWLLSSLPTSYSNVRSTATALAEIKQLNLSTLRNLLYSEEAQRKLQRTNNQTTRPAALHTERQTNSLFRKGNNSSPKSSTNSKREFRCYRCNEVGHMGRDCPKFGDKSSNPKGSKNAKNGKPQEPEKTTANIATSEIAKNNKTPNFEAHYEALTAAVAYTTNSSPPPGYLEFILDSGATNHMVYDKSVLCNIQNFSSPTKVRCAKRGVFLDAYAIGEIYVISEDQHKIRKLTNVLFVPELSDHLMSTQTLIKNGCGIKLEEDGAVVYKKATQARILSGKCNRALPSIRVQLATDSHRALALLTENTNHQIAELWHRRFGHISSNYLKKLSDQNNDIPRISEGINMENCDICCQAKQRRNACNETRARAQRPLEIVHTDTIGPISPASIFGERHIISFLDDFTHYTVALVLTYRSEASAKFEEFYRQATAKFNSKIAILRCDNAREFVMGSFKKFCDENGVILQAAEPYTHPHNGTAERWNRTLMERTRALLFDAKMPVTMWSFAVYAATYLINRTPTSALNWKTPFSLWNGCEPKLKNIKIFGCLAHTMIPYERRTKLQPKSTELILVGFTPTGYLLFNPTTQKTIECANVICDETRNWSHLVPESTFAWTPNELDNLLIDTEPEVIYLGLDDIEPEAFLTTKRAELSYKEAVNGPDKEMWLQAIQDELDAMESNNTWEPIEGSLNDHPLDTVWVFRIKENSGKKKYKARLCVRGYMEQIKYGIADTYSPVVKFSSVRAILAIASKFNWPLRQIDVSNAFLNGVVQNRITLRIPEGVQIPNKTPKTILLLHKSLYGLKTAPKNWNNTLNAALSECKMQQTSADSCVYIDQSDVKCILVNHVDDMLLTGENETRIEEIIETLKSKFRIKDLGAPTKYLGVTIVRDLKNRTISINQTSYINEVLHDFGLLECNGVSTPMENNLRIIDPIPDGKSEHEFRKLIGCLQYIAQGTRPDIAFPTNYLSRFQHRANGELIKYGKRILRFLKSTINDGLNYSDKSPEILEIYCDSDYAGDRVDRKSTSGILIKLFGNTIDWLVQKQSCVTLSTAEAEYVSMSTAVRECKAWINLLTELKLFNQQPVKISCDSSAAVAIATTSESRRTRHIDVAFHNVREAVKNKEVQIEKVTSGNQLADLLTKALPKPRLDALKSKITH